MTRENPKNILIIKPSSLGDIIMALPSLSALRRSFPDARISWFVRPEFAVILKDHPHLDETILFDRKFLGKAWYDPRAMASLVSLICRMRRGKFDLAFDLQGLFRTACLSWLFGCKKRYGMVPAREFANVFYTDKVACDKDNIHVVDHYLKMVKAAGVSDISVRFLLAEDNTAAQSVKKLLETHNVKDDNFAVLVPGSAHDDKCWPGERFATLAGKISKQFGLSIVAIGSAGEKDIAENLKTSADVPIINLAGRTNLRELIELIKAAKLVVSNDTGPGHIAAALGIPLVMIFGRSNPARVFPYRRKECVAAVEPENRGPRPDSDNPKHNVRAVTVEQVYQKACEQLEG